MHVTIVMGLLHQHFGLGFAIGEEMFLFHIFLITRLHAVPPDFPRQATTCFALWERLLNCNNMCFSQTEMYA